MYAIRSYYEISSIFVLFFAFTFSSFALNAPLNLKIDTADFNSVTLSWDKVADSAGEKLNLLVEYILGVIQQTFINVGVLILHFFIVLFLVELIFDMWFSSLRVV